MYAEMIDGLRSHYEGRIKDKASAGYQAAMSMSGLFGICAAASSVIVNAALTGSLGLVMWLHDRAILVVAFGVLTAWAHVRYAKHRMVYNKIGPPMNSKWRTWFIAYCWTAAFLLVTACTIAFRLRQ